jgi:uncharacterized protein YndB with AHSA1/START domain
MRNRPLNHKPTAKTPEDADIVATRTIDVPRGFVFHMWTDHRHVAHWWGPQGFTNPRCEVDARPEGKLRIDMRAPDGTMYEMVGRFYELVEPGRIVLLCEVPLPGESENRKVETLNTVTFADNSGKCVVTVRCQVVAGANGGDVRIAEIERGWQQTLDRLEAYAENLAKKQ